MNTYKGVKYKLQKSEIVGYRGICQACDFENIYINKHSAKVGLKTHITKKHSEA